jgi:hypothetical protein
VTKLKRRPFPRQASYHTTEQLELVHGDLYGPVSPATPRGQRYFLLLVDDATCYMWTVLLDSKAAAAGAIKRHQATTKECGRKLRQTVVAAARVLLKQRGMPAIYWGEAVMIVVHLLNCSPTSALDRSAVELTRRHSASIRLESSKLPERPDAFGRQ